MGNGIDVSSANNVNISNNSVVGYSDLSSSIRVEGDTNLTMNNNVSSGYYITSTTFLSQLANQQSGVISALKIALNLSAPVTTVAQTASVNESGTLTGNAMTGDHGSNIYLADIGIGTAPQKVLGSGGMTLTGAYGTLTIQSNGAYSYVETKHGLTVGQTYDDHFTLTVANQSGSVQTSTLDIMVKVSGTGTAASDTIHAGAGAETITGLGGADYLYSGTGPDTFAYTSVADSPAASHDAIYGFKAGDVIDLSKVDPNFRVVSKFDHHAHELIIVNDGNGAWDLYGDTTGSGSANFQIHLTGATTSLSAGNIVL
jgi:VCBS repeat-containing protein